MSGPWPGRRMSSPSRPPPPPEPALSIGVDEAVVARAAGEEREAAGDVLTQAGADGQDVVALLTAEIEPQRLEAHEAGGRPERARVEAAVRARREVGARVDGADGEVVDGADRDAVGLDGLVGQVAEDQLIHLARTTVLAGQSAGRGRSRGDGQGGRGEEEDSVRSHARTTGA